MEEPRRRSVPTKCCQTAGQPDEMGDWRKGDVCSRARPLRDDVLKTIPWLYPHRAHIFPSNDHGTAHAHLACPFREVVTGLSHLNCMEQTFVMLPRDDSSSRTVHNVALACFVRTENVSDATRDLCTAGFHAAARRSARRFVHVGRCS